MIHPMTDDTRRAEELPHPTIGDLAMLVARLVRQVRKHDPKNDVAEKAMGYLRRHDLQGSVLRETHEKMTAAALRAARDDERQRCIWACQNVKRAYDGQSLHDACIEAIRSKKSKGGE